MQKIKLIIIILISVVVLIIAAMIVISATSVGEKNKNIVISKNNGIEYNNAKPNSTSTNKTNNNSQYNNAISNNNTQTNESENNISETNTVPSNNTTQNGINDDEPFYTQNQPDATEERITADRITRLNNTNTFFSIEKCVSRYFTYLRAGNSKAVYNIIDEEYINLNGLNEQNIVENLRRNINYQGKFTAKEIYVREDNYKPIYFIRGELERNLSKESCYLIMKQDKSNIAFSLKPITKAEYEMYIEDIRSENFEEDIKQGKYNKIINVTLTKAEIAKKYFDLYIQNARYDTEAAYNSLNTNYRTARFGNYQSFVEYLSEKNKAKQLESLDRNSIRKQQEFENDEEYKEYIESLNQATLEKYNVYSENNKEYYICIDSYDNFYIFEIDGVMNYKVYLDPYTIELGYFSEQYKNATTEEKGQINVEKIFVAINDKDYGYIYNKMESNIKTGEYANYNSFASYMEENLFNMNSIEIEESREDGNFCIEKIIITDKNGKSTRQQTMIIELKLNNNNDYTITNMKFM